MTLDEQVELASQIDNRIDRDRLTIYRLICSTIESLNLLASRFNPAEYPVAPVAIPDSLATEVMQIVAFASDYNTLLRWRESLDK